MEVDDQNAPMWQAFNDVKDQGQHRAFLDLVSNALTWKLNGTVQGIPFKALLVGLQALFQQVSSLCMGVRGRANRAADPMQCPVQATCVCRNAASMHVM